MYAKRHVFTKENQIHSTDLHYISPCESKNVTKKSFDLHLTFRTDFWSKFVECTNSSSRDSSGYSVKKAPKQIKQLSNFWQGSNESEICHRSYFTKELVCLSQTSFNLSLNFSELRCEKLTCSFCSSKYVNENLSPDFSFKENRRLSLDERNVQTMIFTF